MQRDNFILQKGTIMGNPSFRQELIQIVQEHAVLQNPWLLEKKEKSNLNKYDFIYWLSQEYHVSVAFVNWFLWTAAQTSDQTSKIILVQNVWEELGEGNLVNTHVSILQQFLEELSVSPEIREILPETKNYLARMEAIVKKSFFHGLGALGPANEYLLKLEYSEMYKLYNKFANETSEDSQDFIPEPTFFTVNLDADEGHSKRMFDLIDAMVKNSFDEEKVLEGNQLALDARLLFYEGLLRIPVRH